MMAAVSACALSTWANIVLTELENNQRRQLAVENAAPTVRTINGAVHMHSTRPDSSFRRTDLWRCACAAVGAP